MNLPNEYITLAAAAPAGEPNPMITLVMFGGLFLFMYLLIIRPQRKRQKEHAAMVLEWIRRKDPTFDKELKDFLFTDKPLTHD